MIAFCTRSLRLSTIARTTLSLSSVGASCARLSSMTFLSRTLTAEMLFAIWSSAPLCIFSWARSAFASLIRLTTWSVRSRSTPVTWFALARSLRRCSSRLLIVALSRVTPSTAWRSSGAVSLNVSLNVASAVDSWSVSSPATASVRSLSASGSW